MHRTGWTRRDLLRGMMVVPAAVAVGCKADEGADLGPGGGGGDVDAAIDPSVDASADAAPVTHVCDETFPRLDLKIDCFAVGDGVTDDSPALRLAAEKLTAAGGGELVIPPGTYLVGKQLAKTDPDADPDGAYYQAVDMFRIAPGTGVSCLLVRGHGATLKVASGLRFGGFDRSTGLPKEVDGRIQLDAAHVGRVFEIHDSSNIVIEGLEIDGSCGDLILGGQWGDIDRQTSATGIWLNRCSNVTIRDVHVHHNGLDGITITHQQTRPTAPKPHVIEKTVSEYNGRQALSWIAGWGLTCTDCKFNHTGRTMNGTAPLASKPGAGVDIEPNPGTNDITRDGLFTRCELADNVGPGLVTAGGDGAYAKFVDCTFWGTTSYSIWAQHPGLEFEDSRFHGTATRASNGSTDASPAPNAALATRFTRCTFEDVAPVPDGGVYRNGTLYTLPSTSETTGVRFTECAFTNHAVRSVIAANASAQEIFDRCTFTFANNALSAGTYQATFRGSRLVSCQFEESGLSRTYYINLETAAVGTPAAGDPPTRVMGPRVHWRNPTGPTGADIAPGMYTT